MAQIVTITNPLTGQPAQVDQLEHTAQQIDDGIGFESTDYPGCYYRMVDGVVEWINPPMALGGIDADGNPINEYRTTERYQGKPVYVKLVDFKALPNATAKAVNFSIENNAQLLECKGFVSGGGVLPYSYPGSSVGTANVFTNKSSGSFGVIVSTDKDLSGKSAYFILKYTKTTD